MSDAKADRMKDEDLCCLGRYRGDGVWVEGMSKSRSSGNVNEGS